MYLLKFAKNIIHILLLLLLIFIFVSLTNEYQIYINC